MRRYLLLLFLPLIFVGCGRRSSTSDLTSFNDRLPKKEETIIVDAGHGGKDPGTCSRRHHYEEKTLTLETALYIRNYLQQLGYNVVLTRGCDTFIPLDMRAEIANTLRGDLFVSIHYNHSPSPEAHGIEVFYYKERKNPSAKRIVESRKLGEEVLHRIVAQTGAKSRGLKRENFAVIRETKMPAILIEGGFLSNPKERERVCDPKYMRAVARGIAKGIDNYLENTRKS